MKKICAVVLWLCSFKILAIDLNLSQIQNRSPYGLELNINGEILNIESYSVTKIESPIILPLDTMVAIKESDVIYSSLLYSSDTFFNRNILIIYNNLRSYLSSCYYVNLNDENYLKYFIFYNSRIGNNNYKSIPYWSFHIEFANINGSRNIFNNDIFTVTADTGFNDELTKNCKEEINKYFSE